MDTPDALLITGQVLAALDALHAIGQVSLVFVAEFDLGRVSSQERVSCALTRLRQHRLLGLENAKTRAEGHAMPFLLTLPRKRCPDEN